ncbi:MAG: tetratricopeptide repeat protein, partial [Zoogloeaceae bacterium]|nr:tetratricopeptide repeat protein [Zoogloeaceae bacterium]
IVLGLLSFWLAGGVTGADIGQTDPPSTSAEIVPVEDDPSEDRAQAAEALFYKGRELGSNLCQFEAASAVLEEVARRFGKDDNLRARRWAAEALLKKGEILHDCGQFEAAIAALEEVARRFGKDDSPEIRVEAAVALIGKGGLLSERGQFNEAIAAWEELDRRFGKDDSPEIRELAAMALRAADELRKQASPPTVEQP